MYACMYVVLNAGNLLFSGNAQNVWRITGNEQTDVLTTGNELVKNVKITGNEQ